MITAWEKQLRVRYLKNVAVVGISENAAGVPLPVGGITALLRSKATHIIIDFGTEPAITSAVLGHMMSASLVAKELGQKFRLCCPAYLYREVLAVTQLDHIWPIYDTLADALNGL